MYELLAPGGQRTPELPPATAEQAAINQFASQVGSLARSRHIALEAATVPFLMGSGRQIIDIDVTRVGTSPNWSGGDSGSQPAPAESGGQVA
jgi:hypothetical protein